MFTIILPGLEKPLPFGCDIAATNGATILLYDRLFLNCSSLGEVTLDCPLRFFLLMKNSFDEVVNLRRYLIDGSKD